jgi:hypothetical protein
VLLGLTGRDPVARTEASRRIEVNLKFLKGIVNGHRGNTTYRLLSETHRRALLYDR